MAASVTVLAPVIPGRPAVLAELVFSAPGGLGGTGALALLVAAAVLCTVAARRRRGRWSTGLELFRWVLIALLVGTLWQPEWRRLTVPRGEPELVVLSDLSRSMSTRDVPVEGGVGGGVVETRAEWLQRERATAFWRPLEDRFSVVEESFGEPPGAGAPAGAVEGTDLNAALAGTLARHPRLRAIILLSDGDWNLGAPPVEAAAELRARGIPVYAVAVGSERRLPDLEVVQVSAPTFGIVGEPVIIPFRLRSSLPREVRTAVRLSGPGGEAVSKEVVIPPLSELDEAIFWTPDSEGEFELELAVPAEAGEVRADNNARSFPIAAREEQIRVLVLETVPRWEYRFLRNALSRDPGVDVDCLLLHPGLPPGAGADYIPDFPRTREALSVYDVVFLGDIGVGPGELEPGDPELLRGLVEQQATGLVFLPGPLGRQMTLLGTPLEALLPVEVDRSKPAGVVLPEPAQLALTIAGQGSLLTLLAEREPLNPHVWRNLPGFPWHAAVTKAKPGAEVLAVHAGHRTRYGRVPLLVTRPAGNGKVLFMGIDNAWRWRLGVEDLYHYRFWGQVARWMAYQRKMAAGERIRLFFTPDRPAPGQAVTLHATVLDRGGAPLQDGAVTGEVAAAEGRAAERFDLEPAGGGWGVYVGRFTPSRPGAYPLVLRAEESGAILETEIQVAGARREETGRPARRDVLAEIAALTRGHLAAPPELPGLVGRAAALPEPEPAEERLRIWSHPAWGALVVGLLSAFWVGRKLAGLV